MGCLSNTGVCNGAVNSQRQTDKSLCPDFVRDSRMKAPENIEGTRKYRVTEF